MANDFKALIGIAYDLKQAQSELDRQIKSLQKSTKLALDIELSDKEAKKVIQDSTKMWSNYRKEAVAAMTAPNTELKKMGQHYKNLEKNIIANNKLNDSIEITKIRAEGANKSLSSYVKTLKPEALKLYAGRINEISDAFTKAQETGDRTDYNKATASLSKFKSEMKDAGMETATLTQKLKENIGAFSQWYFIGNAVGSLVRNFKASINTIKEVDTFLTEISKTSEISAENLKKLGIDAFDYASKYGSTVQAYLSGVQEMSRAGYDEFIAKGLAELSILAQSAGDMTAELANEYLIATNAAYKYDGNVKKLNDVLDSQNQVTNRNAITMSKLAEATKIAGSQAASSGVEVDELTAAITTMGVVTQAEGGVLGRAFRGILMNLQQVKGELENGEIIDEESFTKVEKAADALGVKLKETRDGVLALRDPMQILKELAEEYSKLAEGDVRGANLISSLGGKYRGNQLVALLDNWEIYEKVLNDYKNASGSAAEEAQKTADSIEGRLNKLTNTWNRTVANVVDSDLIKAFVSTGTSAIDLIDKLDLLQTALIGLGGIATYKGLTALIPMLKNAVTSTLAFGNALNTVKAKDFVANTTNLSKAIQGLTLSQATAVLSTQSLSKETLYATLRQAGFSKEQAKTTASTLAMSSAQTVATGTTITLSGAIRSLWAVIAANPIGAVITALTIGYSAFSFISNKVKQDREELLATSKKNTDEYKQENQAIDEQVKKYKELSKQLSDSNISYDDAKNIKDQLYIIQTSLIDSYGLEAEGLDLVNGKYQEQVDILNNLSKQKAEKYLAENKAAFEDAKKALLEEKTYNIGNIGTANDLTDYLSKYSNEAVKLIEYDGYYELVVHANIEEADKSLHQLYSDIEQFGKDTGLGVDNLLISISEQLNKTWTDELKTHKDNYDAYIEAQIIANDTLRPLYKESIDVVEAYNKALTSGDGIEKAKSNLDAIREKVAQNTGEVEGSEDVFNKLFNAIITGSEQSFEVHTDAIKNIIKENEKAIDSYQKSLKTIENALSNASKLSSSDIMDLMQEFSDFDWDKYGVTGVKSVGNLEQALIDLGAEQRDIIMSSIESNDAFIAMYNEAINAANGIKSLSSALSKMNDSGKFLEDVKAEFKELGYISSETLNKIANKYPELESIIAQYSSGIIKDASLVVDELSKAYTIDYENYKQLVINKMSTNEDFYTTVINNLPSWVENQAKAYIDDFDNFKSVHTLKLELLRQLAEAQEGTHGNLSKREQVELGLTGSKASNIQKIIDELDKSANISLSDLKGYTPSKTGGKGKSTDPIKEAFDKKKAEIDHLLAMDKITQQDYLNRLEKLNNEYFGKNKAKYLDQYRKYVEEVYKGRNKLDQDKISKSLNLLKYRLGMDEITEEQYYNQLEKLNEKYLKKYKDKYLDTYEKNVEEIYKGKKKLEEENFNKSLSNMDVNLSEIDRNLKFVDKGSIEELTLLQTGFNEATKNADELNRRIKELNKQYSNGEISQEIYTDRLEKLNSKLFSSADAIRSYRDSIVSYMKSVYDGQLKTLETDQKDALESLEKSHKDILDSLDKQLDRYKEIVNQQKESLRQKQKERDYQKDVEKQTNDITKIEKRIAELRRAALSGDRNATAEIQKLEEQLVEAKEKLDDTQYDRQVELSEEALDKSYDYYEKMIKDQINTQKSLYDSEKLQIESNFQTKMNNINKLYENEMELIIKAADLTKSSFSEAFNSINSIISSYGLTSSSGFKDSYTLAGTQTANLSKVASILGNPSASNQAIDRSGLSGLNKYLGERGYNVITKKQMVEIAQALGLNHIKSVDDVQDTKEGRVNKNLILEALKKARFSKGGYVDFSQSTIRGLNEDGIALVKRGEPILTVEQGKLFKELINNIKPLNNLVKLTRPNIENITKTDNSKSALTLNLYGTVTEDMKPVLNNWTQEIAEIIRKK